MIPTRRPGRRGAPAATLVLALAGALALGTAACGPAGATFAPEGACLADGRAAGAYPDLEAHAPRDLAGQAPTNVDSGRTCTDRGLGTLKDRGVTELRYAGATWDEGGGAGTTIAILSAAPGAPALQAAWVEQFYEAGARASSKTSNVATSRPTIGAAGTVWRLDALNDLSQQAVVVRQLGELVQVVLVATRVEPGASLDDHNRRVELAVETAAGVVLPSGQ